MKRLRKTAVLLIIVAMVLALAGCGAGGSSGGSGQGGSDGADGSGEPAPTEKNGSVAILFTSDVHCGIDQGFGYGGLAEIRKNLDEQGYATILVDNGDSIQGETVGTITKGETMIELMNAMGYDAAIPGNHEFDYGAPHFVELAEKAEFPYISCNFTKEGELVFDPYIIIEAADMKIAFVGVTTPKTISSSTPAYFQNEAGEFIYGFMQDDTGQAVYDAVQGAVDSARAEGADYVYVLGHLGMSATFSPWSYADVIENTNGINVFLDGHSHDTEQVVMLNKDGEPVVRSACGTKLNCIGYSIITPEGIQDTNIWSWPNSASAPLVFGIHNDMAEKVDSALADLNDELMQVVAQANVELTIFDPEAKDDSGNPIRMVRRAETNLGDFCADAMLQQTGADVALMNGGAIRVNIEKGDITYGDIIKVFPFNNQLCVIEATGQQILDALEWGTRAMPNEFGGFLQVAGLSYVIDVSVPSGCVADEKNMLVAIEGERRVRDVMVGGEPIDPNRTYKVGGTDYILLLNGDGSTAFDGAELVVKDIKLDNQALIDYIAEALEGEIGTGYTDPLGDGRITIIGSN